MPRLTLKCFQQVIVLVGHVVVRGGIRAVRKKLKVRADQKEQLEQLKLTETTAPSASGHFTVRVCVFEERVFETREPYMRDYQSPIV